MLYGFDGSTEDRLGLDVLEDLETGISHATADDMHTLCGMHIDSPDACICYTDQPTTCLICRAMMLSQES